MDTLILFSQKLEPKVIDPKMTFDPKSVEVTCVILPEDQCVQVPRKSKYVDAVTLFFNKVVLEPRVSPEHTSKYVDTVTVFSKT